MTTETEQMRSQIPIARLAERLGGGLDDLLGSVLGPGGVGTAGVGP